jgi:cbb3-type cytochrome oxidase maturation protein
MSILFVLIPLSLALVVLAGWGFFWAVGAGQFDDLESPGWDALRDDMPQITPSAGGNDERG